MSRFHFSRTKVFFILYEEPHLNRPMTWKFFKSAMFQEFRSYSCYVDVNDAFYEIFSVQETMMFTASLTLPRNLPYKDKEDKVNRVLAKVGLESCKNTRIGGELFRGLSTGQRRRLSIALELIKEPWILFLDEPLSGLDGTAAAHIMNILTRLADVG